jgi:acylphosphatase
MEKRASLRIRGDVQMAGFRTFIKNVADSLNVYGFAENEKDRSVKVVCEGEGEAIEKLVNSVKQNSPSFARIEEVTAAYEEYRGEFSSFERRGADVPEESGSEMVALMRSFDKKGEVMIGILGSMNETLKGVKGDTGMMLEKQDMMLEKQDMMLEKQDMMLEKQDMMLEKQDMMLEKQNETIVAIDRSKGEIVTEISYLRDDLRSYMEEKFTKIEQDVEVIKAKIGMV